VTAALVAGTHPIVILQVLDQPRLALRITAAGVGTAINKHEVSAETV
jgi:UDP:flavonoid glycosyltransferase YjiC (YdhE family)